jgi:hypothetical protein
MQQKVIRNIFNAMDAALGSHISKAPRPKGRTLPGLPKMWIHLFLIPKFMLGLMGCIRTGIRADINYFGGWLAVVLGEAPIVWSPPQPCS